MSCIENESLISFLSLFSTALGVKGFHQTTPVRAYRDVCNEAVASKVRHLIFFSGHHLGEARSRIYEGGRERVPRFRARENGLCVVTYMCSMTIALQAL